ncbi:hypothetical protein F4824DRAFT_220198 [Ustulina deusta]|nr:hypothetical protein F4824DRAFT_220198 [Ustulina deusta]
MFSRVPCACIILLSIFVCAKDAVELHGESVFTNHHLVRDINIGTGERYRRPANAKNQSPLISRGQANDKSYDFACSRD